MTDPISRSSAPGSDGHVETAPDAIHGSPGVADYRANGTGAPSASCDAASSADFAYLDGALSDAEQLVAYAAGIGFPVEPADVDAVLQARRARQREKGWVVERAAALLATLTRIAGAMKPVTAETLWACHECASVSREIRLYRNVAVALAVIIVSFSCISFVTSGMSDAIRRTSSQ